MKPAPFEMARPQTLAEILELLSAHNDAKVIAGGQSLVPLMNLRMATPSLLVDIGRVGSLSGIAVADGELCIGAMTRQRHLLSDPLVAEHAPLISAAMPYVGHVQTRNRGTVGGSLAHADPAAELPLVIAALNATLVARSMRGTRAIPAQAFFVDALTTSLASDELLTEIRIAFPPNGTRVAFREYARRHGDFAIAAAAVQLSRRRDGIELKAALGGVGTVPHVCFRLAAAAAEGNLGAARISDLVEQEIALLQPQPDLQASSQYRRMLARIALADCLQEVLS